MKEQIVVSSLHLWLCNNTSFGASSAVMLWIPVLVVVVTICCSRDLFSASFSSLSCLILALICSFENKTPSLSLFPISVDFFINEVLLQMTLLRVNTYTTYTVIAAGNSIFITIPMCMYTQ